jgi:flagellin
MSRINTNVQSLIAQRVLNQNNKSVGIALERLSTGLRINRGADDPAGLIGSENLRSEKTALGAAIGNAERAQQVVNIAEGGLQEVSGLLNELNGLITSSANDAGLSAEEKDANQLQIDSILQTIDRVAGATSFQGNKLLDGKLGFNVSSVNAGIDSFSVNAAKLGFGQTRQVDITVTQSAQNAGQFVSFGATPLDLGSAGEQFVLEITGSKGVREFSFASATTITAIQDSINSFTSVTGISAATSGTGVRLDSVGFGKSESVKIKVLDAGNFVSAAGIGIYQLSATDTGTANLPSVVLLGAAATGVSDTGQDVAATINGVVATGKGVKASISTDFLSVELNLTTATAQATGLTAAFTITGGGASFQLASEVGVSGKVGLGIDNVSIRNTGEAKDSAGTKFTLADLASGKGLSVVDGDTSTAQDVVSAAIKEISSLRGRLGAFQKNTVGVTIRSLGVGLENTTAAESTIRDADFASVTAGLTRSQILSQSATTVLQLANAAPQSVLALLG